MVQDETIGVLVYFISPCGRMEADAKLGAELTY